MDHWIILPPEMVRSRREMKPRGGLWSSARRRASEFKNGEPTHCAIHDRAPMPWENGNKPRRHRPSHQSRGVDKDQMNEGIEMVSRECLIRANRPDTRDPRFGKLTLSPIRREPMPLDTPTTLAIWCTDLPPTRRRARVARISWPGLFQGKRSNPTRSAPRHQRSGKRDHHPRPSGAGMRFERSDPQTSALRRAPGRRRPLHVQRPLRQLKEPLAGSPNRSLVLRRTLG
jgi:hypothetical protein